MDSIKFLPSDRRCFRAIGGVLVEHTIEAARFALEKRISNDIEPRVQELEARLIEKEKELIQIEGRLGHTRPDRQAAEEEEKSQSIGILA